MTELAERRWRVVGPETRDGPTNRALDEVAAGTAASGGPRTARVFGWKPSTLSLGYGQEVATIDWAYCDREGLSVTRRPTGGGAIYHDTHGDVSYSIVVPAEEVPGDLHACYELLCQPLLETLTRIGIDASFADEPRPAVHEPACYLRAVDPAHDVVGPDGRKISGNAQYRQRDAVVQHGSLTYERSSDRHVGVFAAGVDPAAFHERVGAVTDYVDVDRAEVAATLRGTLLEWFDAEPGDWSDAELADARTLVDEKYGARSWVRRGKVPARSSSDE